MRMGQITLSVLYSVHMRLGSFLSALALSIVSLTGCSMGDPSCGDVAELNERVNDVGGDDFDEGSMNDYVQAQKDLEAAEQDCRDKGEDPQY